MGAALVPLLVSVVLMVVAAARAPAASAAPRAFFVFGDSLVDNGNNNYLLTTARADAPPYGIDFPSHRATGRFSNGLNIPDIISNTTPTIHCMPSFAMHASQFQIGKCCSVELEPEHGMSRTDAVVSGEHLGAEPALPYLSPELRGAKLLVGANFASAGVGILNDTGVQFVNIIRMGDQLRYFGEYQRKLRAFAGEEQAARLVSGALVLVTLGGNDFVNNYYLVPMSMRSRQYALPDYVRFIVSEYRKILAVIRN
uniref:GDSL esterase/lipase n=1 Tax=Aegilops tauschii TaxID=37682 RepID=R7W4N0_AEGTA